MCYLQFFVLVLVLVYGSVLFPFFFGNRYGCRRAPVFDVTVLESETVVCNMQVLRCISHEKHVKFVDKRKPKANSIHFKQSKSAMH